MTAEFGLFRTNFDLNLDHAPNPKPTAADKRGFGRLSSLYTAFSLDFARFAAELVLSSGNQTVLDPFAGMGTMGEAGRAASFGSVPLPFMKWGFWPSTTAML